jgi:hypothetical protein
MTRELMRAGTLKTLDFARMVREYTPPNPAFVMLEEMPRHIVRPEDRLNLVRFETFQNSLIIPAFTSGRIFHEHGEMRWESGPESTRVVYIGEEEFGIALPKAQEEILIGANRNEEVLIGTCRKIERQAFLFGRRLDSGWLDRLGGAARPGDYAEARIPRLLRYPNLPRLAEAERLKLAFYEYVNPVNGANVAYRFCGLVPFPPVKERKPA